MENKKENFPVKPKGTDRPQQKPVQAGNNPVATNNNQPFAKKGKPKHHRSYFKNKRFLTEDKPAVSSTPDTDTNIAEKLTKGATNTENPPFKKRHRQKKLKHQTGSISNKPDLSSTKEAVVKPITQPEEVTWNWRPVKPEECHLDEEDFNQNELELPHSAALAETATSDNLETLEPETSTASKIVEDDSLTSSPNQIATGAAVGQGVIYGLFLRNQRGVFTCTDTRSFSEGNQIIVKTTRGRELATVYIAALNKEVVRDGDLNIQKINRLATDDDLKTEQKNREKEQRAAEIIERKIAGLKLKMRVVETEYIFDGSRIIFYFISPQKVDFRELVKVLATEFRTRIELRQVNPREYVGLKGAIAPCGQICCCTRFLVRPQAVDIGMADNQRLGKNPVKLNGVCGRLKCCLRYENNFYTEAYADIPPRHACIACDNGKKGLIFGSNVFRDFVTVRWEEGGMENLSFDEIKKTRIVANGSSEKTPEASSEIMSLTNEN